MKLRRILCKVEYIGTGFLGWQCQPQGPTVQSVIESALKQVTGIKVPVLAPSRTDSGVHAKSQVFCFDLPAQVTLPLNRLYLGANAFLPEAVALKDMVQVEPTFNIRANIGKEYLYRIWQGPYLSPFLAWNHWWIRYRLDVELMQEEAKAYLGTHNFNSFRAQGCQAPSPYKTITAFQLTVNPCESGRLIEIRITGDHFMRNMVRIMVGTLSEIGWHRRAPGSITKTILSQTRTQAGQTAPPHGLSLEQVYYDPDPFITRGIKGWECDVPKGDENLVIGTNSA